MSVRFPPTTAITDSAIGLVKLSANGQFFVGAQFNGSNLVTTQVKQKVNMVLNVHRNHKAY